MLDGATILIAEDEEALRRLYIEWLEQEGAEVHIARDGDEALTKWTEDIDVVLLDRRMPETYGEDVLKDARKKAFHTPVGMVTAVDPDLDVIEMEFDEYLKKPVSRDELIRVTESLLKVSEARDALRQFVSIGAKLHVLQQEHDEDLLKTHAEYQSLKREYFDLRDEVMGLVETLKTPEKELLLSIRSQIQ